MLNIGLPRPLVLLCFSALVQGYQWPSPQYDALEDFLYEGARPDGSSMAQLVSPCKLRAGTNTTVAAEWVRLVYHDSATHNVSDGTGGLDGSIFFELGRDENIGSGMNNTLSDFSQYPSKYISRADIIAIGTVWAVATCSGPVIPLRGGRLDANVAGPFGVPNASDPLDSLTNNFAKQGYNVSEMIQLVACGHTLGGVRYPDFPTVVSADSNPSDVVVALFDDTQTFDHNIITQYLAGTTQDPLIVRNQSMASDRLVFGADGNVTMNAMSSADSFAQTCTTIFDKMLSTVPSSVTLTDPIELLPVKVSGVQLTIDTAHQQLQLQASVRLVLSSNNTSVKMYWCDRYGSAANCAGNLQRLASPGGSTTVSSPTSLAMGVTLKKYQFVVPVNSSQSVSKFWFEVDYGNGTTTTEDNGGAGYVVDQDQVLWVPSLSRGKNVLTGAQGVFVTAAVKTGSAPSKVYISCFGRATTNYLPANFTYDLSLNSTLPAMAGYDFYSGEATDDFGATMIFDLVGVAGNGTQWVDGDRFSGLIGIALPAQSTVNSTTQGTSAGGSKGASAAVRGEARWAVALGAVGLLWTVAYL
ncbi:L-ascorbate oxidase [Mycena metata]|uniref:Peroxidase n=1 Tax=Mycena metata TaxID=1033252 RepID=A0AAD7JS68_9AGAR|nr:L-ascorbate oxidase [Mycena metata]